MTCLLISGSFSLRTQLEVRSFVHAENVSKDLNSEDVMVKFCLFLRSLESFW